MKIFYVQPFVDRKNIIETFCSSLFLFSPKRTFPKEFLEKMLESSFPPPLRNFSPPPHEIEKKTLRERNVKIFAKQKIIRHRSSPRYQ